MKTRIDKVTMDLAGQYLVHFTQAEDGTEFPALPSGRCMIFRTKEEVVAFQDAAPAKDPITATKDAVKSWAIASPELVLSDAAGKTSEDESVKPIKAGETVKGA